MAQTLAIIVFSVVMIYAFFGRSIERLAQSRETSARLDRMDDALRRIDANLSRIAETIAQRPT